MDGQKALDYTISEAEQRIETTQAQYDKLKTQLDRLTVIVNTTFTELRSLQDAHQDLIDARDALYPSDA